MRSIHAVVTELDEFCPSGNEADDVYRLYVIVDGLSEAPDSVLALPAIFGLLERHPDAELGSPGLLVHELEAIAGYPAFLRESLRRRPTALSIWMVNRILNSELESQEREDWLSELSGASNHPLVSAPEREEALRFLLRQSSTT